VVEHQFSNRHAVTREWLRERGIAVRQCYATADIGAIAYETEAEEGLVMLRGRIGNTGDRFNLGEATLARCVLRHTGPDGRVWLGVGHVLGRDTAHAQCVAQLDALLQRPDLQAGLLADLVAPLAAQQEEARRQQRAETEATRVRFFTLQPEVS
jgi:alpha-D-ribose 1-methylphosphonate 5-triphosphate synthase subunit PhnG